MMKKNFSALCFYGAIIFLLILEIFCASLAAETLGEIVSALYFLIITINLLPLALIVLNKYKEFSVGIIFVIGLIIIPYQLYLGHQLLALKEEAANLTAYLYEQKIDLGVYSKDLSAYEFTEPNLAEPF